MKCNFSQLVHESKLLLINNQEESFFEDILKKIIIFNDLEGFEDYCYAEYGEYKTICIKSLLEAAKLEYMLLVNCNSTKNNINADKINNLKELIVVLDLLVK